MLSDPTDPQRTPYPLPSTQAPHSWRIRTAAPGCCLLISTQHSTQSQLWGWLANSTLWALVFNTMQLDIGLSHRQTTDSSDQQSHVFYISGQHQSPPGLCDQPNPVHTVYPWLRPQTSGELYSEACGWHLNNDKSSYQKGGAQRTINCSTSEKAAFPPDCWF